MLIMTADCYYILLTRAEAVCLKDKIVGQGYDFVMAIHDKDKKLVDDMSMNDSKNREDSELEVL